MTAALAFLGMAAFLAGLVDAVAGGGGLIQVPALLATLPGESPARLFGTNKLASIFGTTNAALHYCRGIQLPWSWLLPAVFGALVFSVLGAATVVWLPQGLLRPLVLLLLVGVLLHTLRQREFGVSKKAGWLVQPSHKLLGGLGIGAMLGFYDGFFGPGTGSFLIFLFIRVFGDDFLHASASAKLVNVASNAGALLYFAPHAEVIWNVAAVMAVFNVMGALVGSRLAMARGSPFVRKVFIAVSGTLIFKIGYDIAAA